MSDSTAFGDVVSESKTMTDEIVLSLFDYSGNMVKPWAKAGYDCVCVCRYKT